MLARLAAGIAMLLVAALMGPARSSEPIVLEGAGTAHGMGLAMDGVLGQARAGWTHTRILDLFYAGSVRGSHAGTIRVGLARAPDDDAPSAPARLTFELPGGGRLTGGGLDLPIPDGRRVVVTYERGIYAVEPAGGVAAAQTDGIIPIPSEEPGASPSPTPRPRTTPAPPGGGAGELTSREPIVIVPAGDPALTLVEATGRRYRGTMHVRWSDHSQALWAINHVDLETYVAGIAEEKGQGWPHEGLKVLAVAARSLAASTMTWRTNRHPDHNDICATEFCQVYLGYDGEEPAMWDATRATAGEIRTFDGRAILAMYHGNGGGQTDTYRLIYGNGVSDPYPYLRSVRYPYANPKTWTVDFAPTDIARRLVEAGHADVGDATSVEVLERGDSPRVRRVVVHGTAGEVELSGLALQSALELPSSWFSVGPATSRSEATIALDTSPVAGPSSGVVGDAASSARSLGWTALAALVAAVATALAAQRSSAAAKRRP